MATILVRDEETKNVTEIGVMTVRAPKKRSLYIGTPASRARGEVRRVLAALVLLLGASCTAPAQSGADSVWVNLNSGVYHCQGSPVYRATRRGVLLSEQVARQRGYRPAGNTPCIIPNAPPALADSTHGTRGTAPEILPSGGPTRPQREMLACEVVAIADGDSFECRGVGRVRLVGIDAPEGSQGPFGSAARAGLESFAPRGARLHLERDVEERDRYGRLLAYAWDGERQINWLMLRMGWAVPLRVPPNVRYAPLFTAAADEARQEGRGLWAVGGFGCLPEERRRGRC